ncbi:MAG: phage tail tape measure protein [Bacteroidales bacterium]|nr:phage tail tape measure protein [Bacteroidales bacterium]
MGNKTENRRVNLYINGKEVKNSIKGIQAEYKKLVAEQRNMTRGTKEYQAHAKKISKLKALMNQHYQSINKTAGAWGSLQKAANGFNKYFMMISAGIATLTGLVMAFRRAADAANMFEERVDNLSALTGLEGDELEWLAQKAKETSVAIVESGIRIKQSASDIVDAYTQMGSKRPELLKNKQALHEVTMNAIILSEAAKGKLDPSVQALATTLNQFNLQATDSREVINTIAAGSKIGAANIDYLSTAVEKSGTTMALMNMSVEQGIAMIEAVAPKYAQATQAGNSLDKVLLKMRSNNIGYVNGVFDINLALDELRVRFSKGEKAVDIFGERHAKMVEVMVQAQGKYNEYVDLVTGSQIALEQAAKNTDNRATKLAQAKNKITLLAIELGERLSPAMTKAYLGFGTLMKVSMALPKIIKENKTVLLALTGAILAYNAARITSIALSIKDTAQYYRLIAAEKVRFVLGSKGLVLTNARAIAARLSIAMTGKMTLAQGRAIVAQKALNSTMKANPLGLVIIGITALITAFRLYNRYSAKTLALEREKAALVKELKMYSDILQTSYESINTEIGKLNSLSIQEKADLQTKIDKTLKLAEAELVLAKVRRNEIRKSIDPSLWDEFVAAGKSWWVELTQGENAGNQVWGDLLWEAVEKDRDEATQEIDQFIEDMQSKISQIKDSGSALWDILNAEANADEIGTQTLVNLEEKISLYQLALRNAAKGSEDFLRIQQKLADAEKQKQSFGGDYSTKDEAALAQRLADEKLRIEQQLWQAVTQLRRAIGLNELSGQEKRSSRFNINTMICLPKLKNMALM